MSISILLDTLSRPDCQLYANELRIRKKSNPQYPCKAIFLDCYEVFEEDNKNTVSIPYYYAFQKGWRAPRGSTFPCNNVQFLWTLRPEQIQAAECALDCLNRQGSVFLKLRCGFGKSPLSVFLGIQTGLKCLIITPPLKLLIEQWKLLIEESTNSSVQIVTSKTNVVVECDFYIATAPNYIKWCLNQTQHLPIGTVIFDEVHLLCSQQNAKVFSRICPRYQIGLSATPTRTDGLDAMIDLYFGEERIDVPLKATHHVYPINTTCVYTWKTWHELLEKQSYDKERNQMIIDIIEYVSKAHRKSLVLCKRIEQIVAISDVLHAKQLPHTVLTAKQETAHPEDIVIGTVQKCGVGFSCNKLNTLIIAADVEASFLQYLGRVFRTPETTPIIFDLVDNMGILKKHYRTRKQIYESAGGIIHKMIHPTEVRSIFE